MERLPVCTRVVHVGAPRFGLILLLQTPSSLVFSVYNFNIDTKN